MNGDFYIIPSSTDEVIVIPDDGNASVAYMNAMVNEVNAAEVSPEMRWVMKFIIMMPLTRYLKRHLLMRKEWRRKQRKRENGREKILS